jgi:hypothetical protein
LKKLDDDLKRKEEKMGFIAVGLGPGDQHALRIIEPKAISQLRLAANRINSGKCKPQSRKWFGDSSNAWMDTLAKSLNKMASIINTKPIEVVGTNWKSRKERTTAAAQQPQQGWNIYTHMTRAQGQDFRIRLDIAWNARPVFRPTGQSVDSKFLTMVHEVTHLVLNTDDVSPKPYGYQNCVSKALDSPAGAKKNASNWAYFVDNFEVTTIMPYKEWMDATKRGALTPRGNLLKQIDAALKKYDDTQTHAAAEELQKALKAWIKDKGAGWKNSTRNRGGIVERLLDEVEDAV